MKPIVVKIVGETKQLKAAVNESHGLLAGLKKRLGTLVTGASIAGVAAFAKSSVDAFKGVASESLRLQRAMGGTIQEASSWRGALKLAGLSAEVMEKGMRTLSKQIVGNGAGIKALGISTKDATGHIRPMNELLPQIADRFAQMPNGAQKTALAVQLFGRAGMQMLPFLNRGSAGINDLRAKAAQLGLVLDDKASKSVKNAAMQQRLWAAGMEGIKIQIGTKLMPALVQLLTVLNQRIMPVLKVVIDLFAKYGHILVPLILVIGGFISVSNKAKQAVTAFKFAQQALNLVMKANPYILIAALVIALVLAIVKAYKTSETFRNIVRGVFTTIKRVVADVISFIIKILRGWLDMQFEVVAGILHVMGKLPGPMGAPFRAAEKAVRNAKATVDGQIDKIQRKIDSLHGKPNIPVSTQATVRWDKNAQLLKQLTGNFAHKLPAFAGGGRVDAGTTPTADDVLIRASKGETVVSAAHSKFLAPVFAALGIRGYAQGGGILPVLRAPFQPLINTVAQAIAGSARQALNRSNVFTVRGPAFLSAGGAGGGPAGSGQLGAWIAQAMAITHVPAAWGAAIRRRIMFESGGNPRAINLSDSNARRGDPSRGLMQTIMSTFRAYHAAGTSWDIYNPVANIAAAIRYILSRYGSIFRIDPPVRGYRNGTPWVDSDGMAYLHRGEAVLSAAQNRRGDTIVYVTVNGVIATDRRKFANELAKDLRAAIKQTQRRQGLAEIA